MHNIRETRLVEPIEPGIQKAQPGLVCSQTDRVQVRDDGRKGKCGRTSRQLEIQSDQEDIVLRTSFRQRSENAHDPRRCNVAPGQQRRGILVPRGCTTLSIDYPSG